MATIYDVARLARVSTTTVSKVLSNTPYVSEQTKKRVLEAMRQLQYSPSLAARGLTNNRTYVIGLIVPYSADALFADPFVLEIIRGVESVASERDYNVLLSMSKQIGQRSAYERFLRTGYVDGVVALETFEGEIIYQEFEKLGISRVTIGYLEDQQETNVVHSNDYLGGYEAVKYLLNLGHRCIGVIGGPRNFIGAVEARLNGAKDALADYGLELAEDLTVYCDFTVEGGFQSTAQLLSGKQKPTAIFAMNDRMAIGAVRYLREHGLEVPKDISIVGFDDVALTTIIDPPLTTIRQRPAEIGKVAVTKLFSLIDGELTQFTTEVLPIELVIRESTRSLL